MNLENQIPIFCINLLRAIERKQIMKEIWIDKLGLDITFWKAHDRRDVERGVNLYNYNAEITKEKIGRELSAGEIACSSSYISLYQHILINDIPEVIIMEDDITSN